MQTQCRAAFGRACSHDDAASRRTSRSMQLELAIVTSRRTSRTRRSRTCGIPSSTSRIRRRHADVCRAASGGPGLVMAHLPARVTPCATRASDRQLEARGGSRACRIPSSSSRYLGSRATGASGANLDAKAAARVRGQGSKKTWSCPEYGEASAFTATTSNESPTEIAAAINEAPTITGPRNSCSTRTLPATTPTECITQASRQLAVPGLTTAGEAGSPALRDL